jgi:hypothetical protein
MPASVFRWAIRLGYGLAIGLAVLAMGYAVAYLVSDYRDLYRWYRRGGPFYADGWWRVFFFTPTVKAWGNAFCVLALGGGGYVLRALTRSWRGLRGRSWTGVTVSLRRRDYVMLAGIPLVQLACWIYGTALVPPAYDEVFSAFHIAGQGPWRALSYYMLPNNHVLFNVLNALLFGWTGELVWTGRFISLLAWWGLGLLLYGWLRAGRGEKWAGTQVLAILVILPTWGFAIQARGYLLLLLFSWLAFVGAWTWVTGRGRRGLTVFAVASVLAYATVPVYLYIHASLLLWVVWERRRVGWDLLRSQLLAGVATFLFYLPGLTFSGAGALIDNRYVSAGGRGFLDFAGAFLPTLPDYPNYVGLTLGEWVPWLLPLLFLLSVLTYRWWPLADRRLLRFYGILLITTTAVVLLMRAVPFHRSLLFHFSFALLLLLIPVLRTRLRPLVWVLPLVLFFTVPRRFSLHLYYYDIVPVYRASLELIERIPEGATIRASDEAFYPAYLFRQRGGQLVGNHRRATYYLRGAADPEPPAGFVEVATAHDVTLYSRSENGSLNPR